MSLKPRLVKQAITLAQEECAESAEALRLALSTAQGLAASPRQPYWIRDSARHLASAMEHLLADLERRGGRDETKKAAGCPAA